MKNKGIIVKSKSWVEHQEKSMVSLPIINFHFKKLVRFGTSHRFLICSFD